MRLARVKNKPTVTTGMEKAKKNTVGFTFFTFETSSLIFFSNQWLILKIGKSGKFKICRYALQFLLNGLGNRSYLQNDG